MKKGIIMEIEEEFLTLMTPEGEFLHTKRQNRPYTIGEEIHFFPLERVKSSNPFSSINSIFKFKPVWALVAVFVIMLGSLFPMYQSNKAYAYMSIDVNPSIELGVNKKMQVIKIKGINKDGKKIVSHLTSWKKKNVSKLAQAIIAEMDDEGYLSTKNQVIISTVRTEERDGKVEQELKKNIEKIKVSLNKQKMDSIVLNGTEEDREEALKQGISTGKYKESKAKVVINETNSVKKEEQKKPVESIPSESIKKQKENKALQNKAFAENKRQSEKKWINGKLIPPGQLKKINEKQIKQNQERPKKQNNNQKENKAENKKSTKQEKSKGKDSHRNPGKEKKAENKKPSNQEKSEKKDSYRDPGKNNNGNKWKDENKEKEIDKHDNKKSEKSYGNHRSNQKDK